MKTKLLLLLSITAVISSACKNDQAKTIDRPNIVFILADDLGFTDLSCTGSDFYLTPNLDEFAKESMYFDHACSSHSTCQPSRISLQTGKYPARVGAVSHGALRQVAGEGNELPKEEVTLGAAMTDAGYITCHIGKWHVGTGDNSPTKRGYTNNYGSNQFCCPPSYFAPFATTSHGDKRDTLAFIPDLHEYQSGENLTNVLTDKAVSFIKNNKKGPFFLNLAYYAVHTPLQADPELVKKYKEILTPEMRHRNPVYAAMIESLDTNVGRILQTLKEEGLDENTIVIFTSDNGGAHYLNITENYPLRSGKSSMYEGGYRVPLFVRWPGVTEANSVCTERVIGYDFYPTILSMAGAEGDAEHNKHVDGKDLTPLLKDANAKLEEREFHFLKYLSLIHYKLPIPDKNRCVEVVIKGDWKLMEFYPMPDGYEGHYELYNLSIDPYESKNVAEDHPEVIKELKQSMEDWKNDIDAPRYDMEKFYGGRG